MIEIKNLQKTFGDNPVLKDINITILDGEIYGLIGVSGAGKSTLLRCINGLESYDGGSLKINGTEVSDLSHNDLRKLRSKVGMIFQQFLLMERMTVYQNIAFPLKCWGKRKEEIEGKVEELLSLVELEDKRNAKPRELSGGQKQRVAIARALAMDPQILLCDEATSALDPNITVSILQLLKKINRQLGLTIIVVTHQMEVVKQICSRVSVLSHGILTYTGEVKDAFLKYPSVLNELLSEDRHIKIPEGGINMEVIFELNKHAALLSDLTLHTGIPYKLIWSQTDQYSSGIYGSYTINLAEEDAEKCQAYLNKKAVEWRILKNVL